MKHIFFGLTVSFLALFLTSCLFPPDRQFIEGTSCSSIDFIKYCYKGAPVWCVNGEEKLQDLCTDDTFCVEFVDMVDGELQNIGIVGCYNPRPSGPDTCLIIGDYKSQCQNKVMHHYDCLEANDGLSYWVLVESEKCDLGCDESGTHCL